MTSLRGGVFFPPSSKRYITLQVPLSVGYPNLISPFVILYRTPQKTRVTTSSKGVLKSGQTFDPLPPCPLAPLRVSLFSATRNPGDPPRTREIRTTGAPVGGESRNAHPSELFIGYHDRWPPGTSEKERRNCATLTRITKPRLSHMSPGIAYLTTSLTNHPRPIPTQVFGGTSAGCGVGDLGFALFCTLSLAIGGATGGTCFVRARLSTTCQIEAVVAVYCVAHTYVAAVSGFAVMMRRPPSRSRYFP